MITNVELEKGEPLEIDNESRPVYFSPLEDLTEAQKKALSKETKDEFDAIVAERADSGLDAKIDRLETQCKDGEEQSQDTMFDIHAPTSKVKVASIASAIHQSYVQVDPKFSITPRPEFAREGGQEVCDAQQDFLDSEKDATNHSEDKVNRLVELSAVRLGTGIKKKFHRIVNRRRVRKEKYQGTPEMAVGPDGQPMANEQGEPIVRNKGLEEFLSKYPTAIEDYPQYVKALGAGKEVILDVKYTETISNRPVDSFVSLKNFYVRMATPAYDGLCNTRLIAERIPFMWWELKDEEKRGFFFDIDELKCDKEKTGEGETKVREGYKEEKYNIIMCTYQWYMNDEDDEPTRVLCWFEEESWTLIGCMLYPYDGIDSFYLPYYVKAEEEGFYQPGVAEDLSELNKIEDYIWNFGLEGMVISNTFTPIVQEKDNSIIDQLLSKTFTHGVPLISKDPTKISSLQAFMKPTNLNDVITSLHMIGRMEDDVSRVSSYKTGAENPVDPTAPATKTLALMAQGDKNIRDYIECMVPSFNLDAELTLQMYAQIEREGGVPYRLREEAVTGGNAFGEISRAQMVARTNIQSRAMAYDFDKGAEKRQDVALLQILMNEYMIARRPESRHLLYKTLIKGWSPKWRNIVDAVLPSLAELKAEQAALAAKGTAQYLEKTMSDAQLTGQPMKINPEELMAVANQFAQQAVVPAEEPKK